MSKRYWNLSLYRLIATLCIIEFHIFFVLVPTAIPFMTLLSKCVQGLTALSGFLMSQKLISDYKQYYFSQTKKIIIPALVCFTIMLLWNLIFLIATKGNDYVSLFFAKRPYGGMLLAEPGNYYYIPFILICYFATPLLKKNKICKYLASLILIIGEFTFSYFFRSPIIITAFLIGYYVGEIFFYDYVKYDKHRYYYHLSFWLILTGLSVFCYYLSLNNIVVNKANSLWVLLLNNYILTIFGVGTLFIISLFAISINKISNISLLRFSDNITYTTYLLDQAFLIGGMNVAAWSSNFALQHLTVYIFTLSFGIIAYYLSKKIINLLTFKKHI